MTPLLCPLKYAFRSYHLIQSSYRAGITGEKYFRNVKLMSQIGDTAFMFWPLPLWQVSAACVGQRWVIVVIKRLTVWLLHLIVTINVMEDQDAFKLCLQST